MHIVIFLNLSSHLLYQPYFKTTPNKMDDFLQKVDSQVLHLKSEMFEVRQLLKYAFKEDILTDNTFSPPPIPPKRDFSHHSLSKPRKSK